MEMIIKVFTLLLYFLLNNFNNSPPIFLSNPCLVVGIPVSRAIFCFIFVMPNARFHENVTPGILNFVIFLFVYYVNYQTYIFYSTSELSLNNG